MALKGKSTKELLNLSKSIIPPLLEKFHKGQAGRIAVVGGCEDYTGAPYFSAMATTLLGADMSHVVCEKVAGQCIKTYSPNLMVHPYMYDSNTAPKGTTVDQVVDRVKGILDRVHVIVVGPGLGRDEFMLDTVAKIIEEAKARGLPIVVDGDGLFMLQQRIDLIQGYKQAVLTPNVVEFKRLQETVGLKQDPNDRENDCKRLCDKLGGVVVIEKGAVDYISNGQVTLQSDISGGKKRVSGQGDTLSGSVGTFLAWKLAYQKQLWDHDNSLGEDDLMLLSAFAASSVTRTASRLAFEQNGRATLTSHLTANVGKAYSELFEHS